MYFVSKPAVVHKQLIPEKNIIKMYRNTQFKFIVITLVFTRPETLSISPRKADTKELFPAPTVPTTATNCPDEICKLIFDNVGFSVGSPQVNVPFSITRGSSINNKYIIMNQKMIQFFF